MAAVAAAASFGSADPDVHPAASDPCDGVDQNCDGNDGVPEVCDNGLDEDCDGVTDEGFEDKGIACDGNDQDLCTDGIWVCDGVMLVCNDDALSVEEVCNNLDDNCDGDVDENYLNKGAACDGTDSDLCSDGVWVCDGQDLVCDDDAAGQIEVCNDADDDCDGAQSPTYCRGEEAH